MIKKSIRWFLFLICFFALPGVSAQLMNKTQWLVDGGFEKVGRGVCNVKDNVLENRDAYASIGSDDWLNYRFSFEARVPEFEEQVQIWFGFREKNRNERYVVGIKGGLQDDIEIGRMGLMGDDAFLGVRNLNFNPQCGEWYQVAVEVCKNRFRIFLNGENTPRLDVIDTDAHLRPSGCITLGGSWIKNEFRNLKVEQLPENYLDGIEFSEYDYHLSPSEKEQKRIIERAQYKPVKVANVQPVRTSVSLDGIWLFKPGYEIVNDSLAFSVNKSDDNWHLMDVPNFWNPSRIWNYGETFMKEKFPKGISDTYFQRETDRCANYTFDYEKTNVGWYRQWVELDESIVGKQLQLTFDAISKVAEVYVNGQKVTTNVGMFRQINVDVTKNLHPGKNLIAVKVMRDYVENIGNANEIATIAVTVEVTNQMLKDVPHGFYRENPSGIWQPVRLEITNPVKIEDVYIKPGLDFAAYELTVKNYSTKKSVFQISTGIYDKTDDALLLNRTLSEKQVLAPGEVKVVTYRIDGIKPKLWSPESPNLYDFQFSLHAPKSSTILDEITITSGFRTFETKGDYFYLNGIRYWLRGANHTPHALGINDKALAEKTFDLYHNANIAVTRSHTIPYNKVWLDAADKKGVGVSFEGTWPWLMIGAGEKSIPDQKLIEIWKDEWLSLLKRYRNHPSLFYWTINNEMNFTHHEEEPKILEKKMGIVSDVVKDMRQVDPTRPICFDSGYTRQQVVNKVDSTFFSRFDDGDIDDGHNYDGWYKGSIFNNFTETPFQKRKTAGRPLISQEWSTGYPNTETGHHTRNYLWQHQNIQTHVGNQGYPFGNPKYSLQNNAFLSSELAETIRRTHEKMAGLHNFSSLTWFRNVYDAQRVEPYPTYYRMKNSLNPVLVSAELFGRHFYAGTQLPVRFCIVNDQTNGQALEPTLLKWEITYADNRVISSGTYQLAQIAHSSRHWLSPQIQLPENFDGEQINGKLQLYLTQDGKEISRNDYNLILAKKEWLQSEVTNQSAIMLVDLNNVTAPVFDFMGIAYRKENDLTKALGQKAGIYVVSGLDSKKKLSDNELTILSDCLKQGKKLLLLNAGKHLMQIFPGYVSNYLANALETANIDIPESGVFNGIDYMDLRYFNNNRREIPLVNQGLIQVVETSAVECLASGCQHRYARVDDRRSEMITMKGFPIIQIRENGNVIISEMCTEKGSTDPIMGKLLMNMIVELAH
ncbi:MAG: glycoside hydrolase family 2 [Bacteroidales bacterium]|nr:glycoside hydrolase family 2 [Bacteroidales bacterium]